MIIINILPKITVGVWDKPQSRVHFKSVRVTDTHSGNKQLKTLQQMDQAIITITTTASITASAAANTITTAKPITPTSTTTTPRGRSCIKMCSVAMHTGRTANSSQ